MIRPAQVQTLFENLYAELKTKRETDPYRCQSSNIPLLPLWLGIHCFIRHMNKNKLKIGIAPKRF